MKPIRNSVKAIIVHEGRVLAIRKRDGAQTYYILPGGGQHPGEALPDALRRECREELGCEVEVGPLLFVRDYIGAHHEFATEHAERHQVEFFFLCGTGSPACARGGEKPDRRQVGIAWLPLAELDHHPLYPAVLRALLNEGPPPPARDAYLGDVN